MSAPALALSVSNLLVLSGVVCMAIAWILSFRQRGSEELYEARVERISNHALVAVALLYGAVAVGLVPYRPQLALAAGVLAVAWAAVWLSPGWRAYHVVSQVDIAAPPSETFACITDWRRWPSYVDGLEEAEGLTAGPFGRGTRVRVVQRVEGQRFRAVEEVTEFEPPTCVTTRLVSGRRPNAGRYDLEPVEGGTRVTFTYDHTMRWVDAVLGSAIIRKRLTVRKLLAARMSTLGNLKRILEAETAPGALA